MTRPRIGLALGSGSARGWAHIGVIDALIEAGIEPDIKNREASPQPQQDDRQPSAPQQISAADSSAMPVPGISLGKSKTA